VYPYLCIIILHRSSEIQKKAKEKQNLLPYNVSPNPLKIFEKLGKGTKKTSVILFKRGSFHKFAFAIFPIGVWNLSAKPVGVRSFI